VNAFRAAFDYHLRNVLIIWYGAHLAGLLALLFQRSQGETWHAAAFVALIVACIAGVLLCVLALWGIRYPAKPEPRGEIARPAPVIEVVNRAPDYTPIDGQSYQATMQRRKPAPGIAMSEPQLARYIMYLLDGDGVVSARGMAHIGTPADTGKVRRWLWAMHYAIERNKTAVLTDSGRDALSAILPHLARE
jgi:hypothetical protein